MLKQREDSVPRTPSLGQQSLQREAKLLGQQSLPRLANNTFDIYDIDEKSRWWLCGLLFDVEALKRHPLYTKEHRWFNISLQANGKGGAIEPIIIAAKDKNCQRTPILLKAVRFFSHWLRTTIYATFRIDIRREGKHGFDWWYLQTSRNFVHFFPNSQLWLPVFLLDPESRFADRRFILPPLKICYVKSITKLDHDISTITRYGNRHRTNIIENLETKQIDQMHSTGSLRMAIYTQARKNRQIFNALRLFITDNIYVQAYKKIKSFVYFSFGTHRNKIRAYT